MIQLGITYMTESHVLCVCSFLNRIFDLEGFKAADDMIDLIGWDPDVPNEGSSTGVICFVISIMRGLVGHNNILRSRLTSLFSKKYSQEEIDQEYDKEIDICAVAHKNCIRGLLTLGESILRRIPANPLTNRLGSLITGALSLSIIFPIPWDRYDEDKSFH